MTDLELYNKAKEAYYNGTPIMEDFEFDELEKKLGLENKSYIGSKSSLSYTIKHPILMGSLSKVQIKKDENENINWKEYFDEVNKYILRNNATKFIVTPKYDGCSFEAVVENKKIVSISSRGDGEFGKDFKKHLINLVKPNVESINKQNDNIGYILRGEVLIDRFVFENKYSEFVNPRSFVSGLLNRDYSTDSDFQNMLNDLSIVIYDIRIKTDDGDYADIDWNDYTFPDSPKYFFIIPNKIDINIFENLYNKFNTYRSEDCPFALDGIVFKPTAEFRESNIGVIDTRPKDCVAVKFTPMLQETEIVNIEWKASNKTGEMIPVIIVNPVIMDGKEVTRASAHNYGYIIENKISLGTKVILSLAGDIIPFIYKITNTDKFNENNICIDISNNYTIDGVHLYKNLSKEEIIKNKFLASCSILNIPSIGPSSANTIFEFIKEESKGDEFFDIPAKEIPNNILFVSGVDIDRALGGKLGQNAQKAYSEYLKNLTIKDIIMSCSFPLCGEKAAIQIENELLNPGSGDWTSIPRVAYEWIFNKESNEYKTVMNIINFTGIDIEQYRIQKEESDSIVKDQIPVILTGEPNDYLSKGDFLNKHPEYRMTGSWKEVQIVFTNSLDSNTGKMKKAREKGIEIKLY